MNRPHILLITTDQQRFDALGINGNPDLETPNLDALAARGVNFTRSYSTCPVCIPARRTLLSGQHPFTHGLRWYQDGLEWDPPFTLPAILGDAGYQTQLVGKLHMHPMGKRYGYDNMVLSETSNYRPDSPVQTRNDYVRWLREQGVQEDPHFHGIGSNSRLVSAWPLEDRFHQNNWLAQEATRFLCEDRDPTQPFFLHLSFFHPHPPLVPPRDYLERYLSKDVGTPSFGEWAAHGDVVPGTPPDSAIGPFDEAIMRRARAAYYALINHIDDCVARVIERWRTYQHPRGKEPLYILYGSDHGEMLGDHHLFRKSLAHEGSSHVPFFISGYNVDMEPATRTDLCSWEDVLPTIAELASVTLPGEVDGRSLAPALRGETTSEPESLAGVCHGQTDNYWIVRDHEKYVYYPATGEEQLFDLATDPQELHDCSADTTRLQPGRRELARIHQEHGGFQWDESRLTPCRNRPPVALYGK